jgi:signal transduction histidine kinase
MLTQLLIKNYFDMPLRHNIVNFFSPHQRTQPSAEVRAGLMNAWHEQEPVVIVATMLAAILFVIAMYPHQPFGLLIAWLIVKTLFFAVHIVRVTLRRPKVIPPQEVARWERELFFSATVAGFLWGATGVIFFTPDQTLIVLYIGFVLFGVSGSLVASLAAYWPAYPPYAMGTLCPLVFSCIMAGGELFVTMGIMCLLYMFTNIFFSRAAYHSLRTSVELRFANLELIAQLQDEKDRVIAADRTKTKFLAAASHDLRQPIHALGMFASTLATLAAQPALKRELMQEITQKLQLSVKGLSSLLNTLLDISKLDAGVVEKHTQKMALQTLFDSVEGEFSEPARQKSLQFKVMKTSAWVMSDPVLLKQILNNLVSNAIRYTEKGRVIVGARRRGGNIEIQIWDSGQGIAADQHEAIFGEFIQLHNPQRDREQGLGLGLSIVKRTAALLDHQIQLRSQLGRGTGFSVFIKAVDAIASPISSAPTISAAQPDSIAKVTKTVVLIDDDKDVLEAMRLLVTQWQYQVITAHSADAAVALLATTAIDELNQIVHIVSDYRLADGLNGADAIRAVLNQLKRDVPATIITGDTSPERIREAATSGFKVLHKPLEPELLRAVILG